jgi:hypothetical protein
MATFVCGQLHTVASFSLKNAKKAWPRVLVLKFKKDADGDVRTYYDQYYMPARTRLAEQRKQEQEQDQDHKFDSDSDNRKLVGVDWLQHYVRGDASTIYITDFDEQDLFLEHVAVTTNVPKSAIRACLLEEHDSSLDCYQ